MPDGLFGFAGGSGAERWAPCWAAAIGALVVDRADGAAGAYGTTGTGRWTLVGRVGVPGAVRRCTTGSSPRRAAPVTPMAPLSPVDTDGEEIRATAG
ncbi:hypothetical protein [Streptomyces sp. NPDC001185]|uniref:hypothetical protein n=1 Tax=Streptomyces sp. NPDC001185 TaxID=3154380 RepID=UPI003333D116